MKFFNNTAFWFNLKTILFENNQVN
jgi:hypothetical protein